MLHTSNASWAKEGVLKEASFRDPGTSNSGIWTRNFVQLARWHGQSADVCLVGFVCPPPLVGQTMTN